MRDRVHAVADLLVAAAHADHRIEVEEIDRIEEILKGIGTGDLPAGLRQRMDDFDPDGFDMNEAVGPFLTESSGFKRKLLELVVSVHESDGELDFHEDTFVRELGYKLGLAEDEYCDLCLEFLPEDASSTPAPPPPPAAPRIEPPRDLTPHIEFPETASPPTGWSDPPAPPAPLESVSSPPPAPRVPTAPQSPGAPEPEWSFADVRTGQPQRVLELAEEAQRKADEELAASIPPLLLKSLEEQPSREKAPTKKVAKKMASTKKVAKKKAST